MSETAAVISGVVSKCLLACVLVFLLACLMACLLALRHVLRLGDAENEQTIANNPHLNEASLPPDIPCTTSS